MKNILNNIDYDSLDAIGLPPIDNKGCDYNIRAIMNYCREQNISLESITEKELKQFEINS